MKRDHCFAFDATLPPSRLGSLRCLEGLAVAPTADHLWVSAPDIPAVVSALRALPFLRHYRLGGEGALVPEGGRLAERRLPPGVDWQPLGDWLRPEAPRSRLPGNLPVVRIGLTLAPDEPGNAPVPNFTLTRLDALRACVDTVPGPRLAGLQWAALAGGASCVAGSPVLPLPGRLLHLREGLAVPWGHRLDPPLSSDTYRELLGLPPAALAVFMEDGSFFTLDSESLVPLCRSSVRLTWEREQCAGSP